MAERAHNAESVCDCGHLQVAHEPVVRAGKGWFALGTLESTEEREVWSYCGHCEDGCVQINGSVSEVDNGN